MEDSRVKSKTKPQRPIAEREFLRRIRGNISSPDPRKHQEAARAIDNRLKEMQNKK